MVQIEPEHGMLEPEYCIVVTKVVDVLTVIKLNRDNILAALNLQPLSRTILHFDDLNCLNVLKS